MVGATGGIGSAIAEALAEAGHVVHVAGRNQRRLEEVQRRAGGVAARIDFESPGVSDELLRIARDRRISPDVVVNAQGVFELGLLSRTSIASFERNLRMNLESAFLVAKTFLERMLQRRRGLLVSIGSIAGRRAFPRNGAYSASKYGLRGMHETLSEELRGTGVRASLVEPGAVDTRIWDSVRPELDPELPDRAAMLRPADVARAVRFLVELPDGVVVPFLPVEAS